MQIKGKGVLSFKCKNGEERTFSDVYYVPKLCNNIISLGQLSEAGNKVVLEGDFLWVYVENGRLRMKVKKSENLLYKISLEDSSPVVLLSKTEEDTWLGHTRLGHVNFKALELMYKESMAHGIPKMVHPLKNCEGFLMSKHAWTPFPTYSTFEAKKTMS